ncbi:MAG: transglutaminase-like cysteine peptidase [Magnetococcales bacterium]|nr:transglutaminase-like cysteine peptidase [Magnetococcales bacterium]
MLFTVSLLLIAVANAALDKSILVTVKVTYGELAYKRVLMWQEMIRDNQQRDIKAKLQAVNNFFNQVRFLSDIKHWKQEDFWATPLEMLISNGGDCEDYSIAKFFTLKELGIPENNLRITYVKSLGLNQAHMVLIYAPKGKPPLVLDNLDKQIKPASERKDLKPVYSFNGRGLWKSKQRGRGKLIGGAEKIPPWRDLEKRMDREMLKSTLSGD